MDRVRAVHGLMHFRLYCVGVQAGKFHITMDFLGDVFRATAACASPRANSISDLFHGLVGFVGPPIFVGADVMLILCTPSLIDRTAHLAEVGGRTRPQTPGRTSSVLSRQGLHALTHPLFFFVSRALHT